VSRAGKVFLIALSALAVGVAALYLGTRSRTTNEPSPTPLGPGAVDETPEVTPTDGETPIDEPEETPGQPIPPGGAEEQTIWNGSDDAVATWFSEACNREVLRFGAQQYASGAMVNSVPPNVSYLEYQLGDRRLFGDRGAPSTLYVTADGGETFREWFATDQNC
jgi:hypothetical protein